MPKSFKTETISATKNNHTIDLVPVKIGKVEEGKIAWSYPSLPVYNITDDKDTDNDWKEAASEVRAFLGNRKSDELLVDAFDSVCQRLWKAKDNDSDFLAAIVLDVQRRGKEGKLSVKLFKQLTAAQKLAKDETQPVEDRKTALANAKKLKAEYMLALSAEMDDIEIE